MSEVIDQAVAVLNEKLADAGLAISAKFVIEGEGSIMLDGTGARAADEDADVTMTADADTFSGILDGSLSPMGAFTSGRLTVDGDMTAAMQLVPALS